MPGLSIPEGQSVTAVTGSSASPDSIMRSTVCVCVVNWNQEHILVASWQRHIDSVQRFTVHNDMSCNKTSHAVQTDTHDRVSMSLYMC